MATVANSLIDRNAIVIKETIGTTAMEFVKQRDPIFREMVLGPADFVGANEIGRDLRMKHRYYGSLAGVIRGGNLNNFFSLFGDQTTAFSKKLFMQSLTSKFPDPTQGPYPAPYGMTSTLYSIEFNLMLTLTMLQMDALPANIKEHVVPVLRGFAENIALWACNQFYANQSQSYRLGTIPTSGYTIVSASKQIIFKPTEKSTHRFHQGQAVDLFPSTFTDGSTAVHRLNGPDAGASQTTDKSEDKRVRVFVAAVNDWTDEVTLVANPTDVTVDGTTATFGNGTTTGWTGSTLGLLAGARVVPANTFGGSANAFKGLYGYRDWTKFGGTADTAGDRRILGNSAITDTADDYIEVTDHPEFRSGHFKTVGTLTERKLLSHLDRAHHAFDRYGMGIDTLLAARGIWLNVFEQDLTRETIERGGRPGTISGYGLADGGFQIVHEGRTYKGYTSKYLEDGVIFGTRRAGNWKMVVPPDPAGTTRGGLPNAEEKLPMVFVMPALTGTGSASFPILDASGTYALPTEGKMMPGYLRMQFMPKDQIPGVLWEGVSATIIDSDNA